MIYVACDTLNWMLLQFFICMIFTSILLIIKVAVLARAHPFIILYW